MSEEQENELVEDILSEFRKIGIDTSTWEYEFGDGNFAHEFIAAGVRSHIESLEKEKEGLSTRLQDMRLFAWKRIYRIKELLSELSGLKEENERLHRLMVTGEQRGVDKSKEEIAALQSRIKELEQQLHCKDDLVTGSSKPE